MRKREQRIRSMHSYLQSEKSLEIKPTVVESEGLECFHLPNSEHIRRLRTSFSKAVCVPMCACGRACARVFVCVRARLRK